MGRYIAWGRPSRKGGGSFFGELQPTDDLYATLSARHQIRQQAAVQSRYFKKQRTLLLSDLGW